MLITYRTELNPTDEQKHLINQYMGIVRFLQNKFIAHQTENYQNGGKYVHPFTFNKWLNKEFLTFNPDFKWIKNAPTKAVKQALMDTHDAFIRFFKGQSSYPKFKKKTKNQGSLYFVKNDKKSVIPIERHRIRLPKLGWVKLKEKGYLPTNNNPNITIKSGRITKKAGRYYVSILVEVPNSYKKVQPIEKTEPIGIDLGIKYTAVCSNGQTYKNINKSNKIKKLEKKLKREQRRLSRKYEMRKKHKNNNERNATRQNINKQRLKIQKIEQRLTNIRNDFQNKMVSELAKTTPKWVTIEDLNISGMLKNKHLSKAIQDQKLYRIKTKLIQKSNEGWFELRIVDRWFPSSKLCHRCGNEKKNLTLSDRIYSCDSCGTSLDRDLNASLNLRDAVHYSVLA